MSVGFPDWGAGGPVAQGITALLMTAVHIDATFSQQATTGITRQGYEIFVNLRNASGGAVKTPVLIELTWQDGANNFTVAYQRHWVFSGDVTGAHLIHGAGPARGRLLIVKLTNFNAGTPTIIASVVVLDVGRLYPTDRWRTFDQLAPVYPGYTAAASDVDAGIAGAFNNINVPISSSVVQLLPYCTGKIAVKQFAGAGNGIDLQIAADAAQPAAVGGGIFEVQTAAGIPGYTLAALPNAQCAVTLKNTSGTAAITSFSEIIAFD